MHGRMASDSFNGIMFWDINSTHIFYPIVMDTVGSCGIQAVELMEEIGKQITATTDDQNETM